MRTACATHSSLITGSMPGIAASTSDTWLLGSAPNAVEEPEKSFEREATCACTSRPTMTSQSPVAPGMRLLAALALSCMRLSLLASALDNRAVMPLQRCNSNSRRKRAETLMIAKLEATDERINVDRANARSGRLVTPPRQAEILGTSPRTNITREATLGS